MAHGLQREGVMWAGVRVLGVGMGLLMVGAVAACEGEPVDFDEAPDTSGLIEESEVPAVLAEAQCEAQMGCECLTLTGPVGEDPEAFTMATCVENRTLELAFWQEGARFNDLVFDAACLSRRLELMETLGCDDAGGLVEALSTGGCDDHCRVYHGDLEAGAVCDPYEVDRCGQGLHCVWNYDSATGYQQAEGVCEPVCVKQGQNCEQAFCEAGTVCAQFFCQAAPAVGEPCRDWACGPGAICSPATETCTAITKAGEGCSAETGSCLYGCLDGICQAGPSQVCQWDFRDDSPYGYYY